MKKEEQLLRDIGEVRDEFIEEADTQIAQQAPKHSGISWKYCAAAAACIAAVIGIASLPDKNDLNLPPAEQQVTMAFSARVSETDRAEESVTPEVTDSVNAVTEPVSGSTAEQAQVQNASGNAAVTEKVQAPQKTIQPVGSLTGSGKALPASHTMSDKRSYLPIDNQNRDFYSVENGYYQLNFLSDTGFQNRINEDIKKASDEISLYYDPGYLAEKDGTLYKFDWKYGISNSHPGDNELEEANGIVMELICENGYLSVVLGYLDCDGYTPRRGNEAYGSERCWDVVRTLNYDIINQKKIDKVTDLFYEGTDALSELRKSVFSDNHINTVSDITDYPENFTIYYILQDNRGMYYNDYSTLLYNDSNFGGNILKSLVTSEYRDMSGVLLPYAASKLQDYDVPECRYETVTEDGISCIRIGSSLFLSDEEINRKNADMKTVQHKAAESYLMPGYGTESSPVSAHNFSDLEYSRLTGIWTVSNYAKEVQAYYDAETLDELTLQALLGDNWQKYTEGTDATAETPVNGLLYEQNDAVSFEFAKAGGGYNVVESVPLSEVNPKYLK